MHLAKLACDLIEIERRHGRRVLDQKIKATARKAKAKVNSNFAIIAYRIAAQPRIEMLPPCVARKVAHDIAAACAMKWIVGTPRISATSMNSAIKATTAR